MTGSIYHNVFTPVCHSVHGRACVDGGVCDGGGVHGWEPCVAGAGGGMHGWRDVWLEPCTPPVWLVSGRYASY